jgi:hypothetical protein
MANHIFKKADGNESERKKHIEDLHALFSNQITSRVKNDDGKAFRPLAQTTITNYVNKLNRVANIVTKSNWYGDDSFLYDFENVEKKLKNSDLKALKDYVSPIVKYLRQMNADERLILKYQKLLTEFKNEENSKRGDNQATKKQQDNALSMEEINQKIDDFQPETKQDLLYKLLLVLYFQNSEFTPRLEDIPLIKLANSKRKQSDLNKDFNYITTSGEQGKLKVKDLIMNNYKTKSSYGTVKFPIPDNVKDILNAYIRAFDKQNGDFLILNTKNEPYLIQTFSSLLSNATTKILEKPLSVNLIRRIKISDFLNKGPHSINDEEKEAKKYLHSKEVAREYLSLNLLNKDD